MKNCPMPSSGSDYVLMAQFPLGQVLEFILARDEVRRMVEFDAPVDEAALRAERPTLLSVGSARQTVSVDTTEIDIGWAA